MAAEPSRRASDIDGHTAATATDGDVEKAADASNADPSVVDEAEANYKPKTLKFWSVLLSIYLALFLVSLDRTIIGTAIPQITQEFNSLGDIGWYGSAYQLTTAASQLIFGRVYRFYEVKRTFLATVALFEIGSVICGAAPTSIAFIIGRAIAGVGSAGIFTGVMMIMLSLVPLRKRPVFQSIFGTVFGISSVIGPLIGGAFTDSVTWRWCFYINLPVGAAAALGLLLARIPTKRSTPAPLWEHFTRLDPLGTFFFVPGIVCLLLALQWGGSTYEWGNWRIILLFVLFGVLLLAFAAVQIRMPDTATIPVRVMTQRSIAAAALFMLAIAGSMMMCIYYMPLWFQVVQGVSATQSGVNTLPFVLSLVVGSILSGGFTQRVGYYVPAMLACPAIMAIGEGLMTTFRVNETTGHWVGYQFIAGFGLGMGMQTAGLAAQAVLANPDVPIGIALMFFCQQLGGAVFTSVGQNLLSTYMVAHVAEVPGLDPKQITNQGAADVVNNVAPEYQLGVRELYNKAITKIFLCCMGIVLVAFVAAFFVEWKNIKKTGPSELPRPSEESTTKESPSSISEEKVGIQSLTEKVLATPDSADPALLPSDRSDKDERESKESRP
ncbi:MFS general substrate transporter [Durotheca rogersii]|uniref:MFS general substrate transporter n=1 Tax=Durotheca rogersii TaxID=419775 RepID=UPI00221EFCDB|nr:MFS general substrate transporter [Durotheca rogersii]KAI5866509.1 MFS general substrate transporter [Durotheca rogersii]